MASVSHNAVLCALKKQPDFTLMGRETNLQNPYNGSDHGVLHPFMVRSINERKKPGEVMPCGEL